MKSKNPVTNQTDNGGNEKTSAQRGGTADKGNLDQAQSQQSGMPGGSQQQQRDRQQDTSIGQGGMNRSGSQSGSEQQGYQSGSEQQGQPGQRQSNDLAGGLPKSPRTSKLSADEDMDDDTGLSNRGNRQSADDIDEGTRQQRQSNVGRRDDGTPD